MLWQSIESMGLQKIPIDGHSIIEEWGAKNYNLPCHQAVQRKKGKRPNLCTVKLYSFLFSIGHMQQIETLWICFKAQGTFSSFSKILLFGPQQFFMGNFLTFPVQTKVN